MKNFKSFRHLTKKEVDIRSKRPNAQLVTPSIEFLKSYMKAIEEGFRDYAEVDLTILKDEVQAQIFLRHIKSGISWDTKIPCHVFWLIENNIFLGRIRIKNLLTPFNDPIWDDINTFRSGHIGYSIAPAHRGQGISILQLSLALDKLQELAPKLPVAFHTIDILNIASIKTTLGCGYVLHDSFHVEGNKYQIFVLPLKSNTIKIPNYSDNT